MSEINYDWFLEIANDKRFRKEGDNFLFEYTIRKMDEMIEPSDIKMIYPKNLLVEGDHKELIIFFEESIKIVSHSKGENEREVHIKTLNKKDIEEVDLDIKDSGYESAKLTIRFIHGYKLEFNSIGDSNTHWHSDYLRLTKEIYKMITKEPQTV